MSADTWVGSIAAAVASEDGAALAGCFALLTPSTGTWRKLPVFAMQQGGAAHLTRLAAQHLDGKVS